MVFRAARYPIDWKQIRRRIVERAGNRCECTGQCGSAHDGGRCDAPHGRYIKRAAANPAQWSEHDGCSVCLGGESCNTVRVVLTVAHLDHDECNNADSNLLACCQRCHLQIDRVDNIRRRRRAQHQRRAVRELPGL